MALSVTRVPPRSTSKVRVSPALVLTIRCISVKLSTARPLIVKTTSPGWNPAAAAALSAWTWSTRGDALGFPKIMKMPAKITMASRKFATGPATTMAALGATG